MTIASASAAVQYIRMSSDSQVLSPEIQKTAIHAYAIRKGITIVETYSDEGKSGLTLERRPAMRRLLTAVSSAHRQFSMILVYDVTRWGRFADPDASAYYEYHCRLQGVDVIYVEEPFLQLDNSLVGWMYKGMKRFMAAETSRELSVKTIAGQQTAIHKGYQLGTLPCLGIARVAVSKFDGSKRVLGPLEHKAGRTEHVKWTLGPEHEIRATRRIFELYAKTEISVVDLSRQLEREGFRTRKGDVITEWMLYSFLRSETVLGNFLWGRAQEKRRRNETHQQFRRVSGMIEPVVSRDLFDTVQAKLGRRSHVILTKEALTARLRSALAEYPHLRAHHLMTRGCPCRESYIKHFGSVKAAWLAAGAEYPTKATEEDRADVERCIGVGASMCSRVLGLLQAAGVDCQRYTRGDRRGQTLLVNHSCIMRVQTIWRRRRYDGSQWALRKTYKGCFAYVLVVRMTDQGIPFDSILLTRKEYFASDKWLHDELVGDWEIHRSIEEVVALMTKMATH